MFPHPFNCGLFCCHLCAAKLPDVHPADEDVVSEGYLTASPPCVLLPGPISTLYQILQESQINDDI